MAIKNRWRVYRSTVFVGLEWAWRPWHTRRLSPYNSFLSLSFYTFNTQQSRYDWFDGKGICIFSGKLMILTCASYRTRILLSRMKSLLWTFHVFLERQAVISALIFELGRGGPRATTSPNVNQFLLQQDYLQLGDGPVSSWRKRVVSFWKTL